MTDDTDRIIRLDRAIADLYRDLKEEIHELSDKVDDLVCQLEDSGEISEEGSGHIKQIVVDAMAEFFKEKFSPTILEFKKRGQ